MQDCIFAQRALTPHLEYEVVRSDEAIGLITIRRSNLSFIGTGWSLQLKCDGWTWCATTSTHTEEAKLKKVSAREHSVDFRNEVYRISRTGLLSFSLASSGELLADYRCRFCETQYEAKCHGQLQNEILALAFMSGFAKFEWRYEY